MAFRVAAESQSVEPSLNTIRLNPGAKLVYLVRVNGLNYMNVQDGTSVFPLNHLLMFDFFPSDFPDAKAQLEICQPPKQHVSLQQHFAAAEAIAGQQHLDGLVPNKLRQLGVENVHAYRANTHPSVYTYHVNP